MHTHLQGHNGILIADQLLGGISRASGRAVPHAGHVLLTLLTEPLHVHRYALTQPRFRQNTVFEDDPANQGQTIPSSCCVTQWFSSLCL